MARTSTLQHTTTALVVFGVTLSYSLFVSLAELRPLTTVIVSPLVLLLAFGAARSYRGMPATMKGIGKTRGPSENRPPISPSSSPRRVTKPRFQLVAMPVNHYGEKLRWCLDLVGAPYEESTVGGLISAFGRGRSHLWKI